jgi:hypothetical protein
MRTPKEPGTYIDTRDLIRPPCWPRGIQCPNPCAAEHHDRVIYNKLYLHGPWAGWRFAGRDLVSPDGDRISVERMKGLIWRADASDLRDRTRARNARRKAVRQQMVKVVVVDLADWRERHFGTRAG